jgi:hypothetical protein
MEGFGEKFVEGSKCRSQHVHMRNTYSTLLLAIDLGIIERDW